MGRQNRKTVPAVLNGSILGSIHTHFTLSFTFPKLFSEIGAFGQVSAQLGA